MNLLPRGFAEGEENNTYTSINGKLLHFLSNKRRKEDQECRELAERSDFWGFLECFHSSFFFLPFLL